MRETTLTDACGQAEVFPVRVGAVAARPYCITISAAAAAHVGATYQNDLS